MLTVAQLEWAEKASGVDITLIDTCIAFDFLAGLARNFFPTEIEMHDDKYRVYARNKMGNGHSLELATQDLVKKLCPTPDPDPYLVENLIETLAPGPYPTYADKVTAAEARSKAEADGHLSQIL